jgi:serine/threonine protein kinase/tetratricopeptide (TPR) repeat protein
MSRGAMGLAVIASMDLARAKLVFDRAVVLPREERDAVIARECGTNDTLRSLVGRLLSEHDQATSSILTGSNTEAELEIVGPYRLIARIGEGAFGVVYLAEQREPVRRRVALKILKLGMDSKEVIARFEAERQALALMDHPNVAMVHDAGTSVRGRPYFAMEHVPGVPITEFCDDQKLGVPDRVELFLQVCAAVQHAHQKGVIHRDIKPNNLLVMLVDGKPVCKVIDFGIAKATSQQLTARTLFTEAGRLVGTPEYMSPEQAGTSGLDVDTRTDIYSLGVVLYELLSGALPFASDTLRKAGFDGIVRLIKNVEPPRLTTRLSRTTQDAPMTDGAADALCGAMNADGDARKPQVTLAPNQVAACRGTDVRGLLRQLRGDLDWIVYKSMEKDRARRYDTAGALAADLTRHLNSQPVTARPPSLIYQCSKALRRHRSAAVLAAVFAVLVIFGAATYVYYTIQIARQRDKSVAAEAAAAATQQFLTNMIAPERGASRGPRYTLQQLLDDGSAAIHAMTETDAPPLPKVEAAIRHVLGTAYSRLSAHEPALEHLREAARLRRADPSAALDLADSLAEIAIIYIRTQGAPDGPIAVAEARSAINECVELRRQWLGPSSALTLRTQLDARWVDEVAAGRGRIGGLFNLETLSVAAAMCDCPKDAAQLQQDLLDLVAAIDSEWRKGNRDVALENLARAIRQLCPKWDSTEVRERAASSMLGVALDVRTQTTFLGATEALYAYACELAVTTHGKPSRTWIMCSNRYASFLMENKRLEEATTMLREAANLAQNQLGENDQELMASHGLLAICAVMQGDLATAQSTVPTLDLNGDWLNECAWTIVRFPGHAPEVYAFALELAKRLARVRWDDPACVNTIGVAEYRAGQYEQSLKTLRRAVALRKRAKEADVVEDMAFIAMAQYRLGQAAEARKTLAYVVELMARGKAGLGDEVQFLKEAQTLIEDEPGHVTAATRPSS